MNDCAADAILNLMVLVVVVSFSAEPKARMDISQVKRKKQVFNIDEAKEGRVRTTT
jgi:hypothetical protein